VQLEIEALGHGYDGTPVLRGLDLALDPGEIGCLLGPSGCGKSTVLRCVAGFERPRQGRVRLAGRTVVGAGTWVPPEARGIGMVFQDHALFPHLDVHANVAFGLHRLPRVERRARADRMLETMGLQVLATRRIHELSGGQAQRVALARALAPAPALLLLDEPFAALDVDLRERLNLETRAILKAAGATALVVTHDQHEAFAIADRVGVLHDGALVQWDTPYAVYHRPATRFVADFVGEGAFLHGTVRADGGVDTELGTLAARVAGPAGRQVELLLRPDDVVHDDASAISARVVRRVFRGAEFLYTVALPSGSELLALVPSHHDHPLGQLIGIRLDVEHVVAFPA
jgi:iron(III) transport system ATP-binding protein